MTKYKLLGKKRKQKPDKMPNGNRKQHLNFISHIKTIFQAMIHDSVANSLNGSNTSSQTTANVHF